MDRQIKKYDSHYELYDTKNNVCLCRVFFDDDIMTQDEALCYIKKILKTYNKRFLRDRCGVRFPDDEEVE